MHVKLKTHYMKYELFRSIFGHSVNKKCIAAYFVA